MEMLPMLPPTEPVIVHQPWAAVPQFPAHEEAEEVVPLALPGAVTPVPVGAGDGLLLFQAHRIPGNTLRLLVLLVLVLRETWLITSAGSLVRLLVSLCLKLLHICPHHMRWLRTARTCTRNLLHKGSSLKTSGSHHVTIWCYSSINHWTWMRARLAWS